MALANGVRRSRILGTGHYLPAKVLTNRELEQLVDTSDEWIASRTGIRQRHVAAPDEATSDMATQGGQARARGRRHRGDADST